LIFLTPLIFFHELGHFLMARLFGVRVEVFSLGFGRKIFKFVRHKTEYAISLIPLGGYVKMFGDDPFNKDSIKEEERPYSFVHQGKWARFWIVFAGPLANFILAFGLFFALVLCGEKAPELRFGMMQEAPTLYQAGVRAGDVLREINHTEIWGPTDLMLDEKTTIAEITVERQDALSGQRTRIPLTVNLGSKEFFTEFSAMPEVLRQPRLVDREQNFYLLSFAPDKVQEEFSLEEMANAVEGKNEVTVYLHQIPTAQAPVNERTGKVITLNLDLQITPSTGINKTAEWVFLASLAQDGFRALDVMVKSVVAGSAAAEADLQKGDVISSINHHEIYNFFTLRQLVQQTESETLEVGLWRQGKFITLNLRPRPSKENGKTVKLIGVAGSGLYQTPTYTWIKAKSIDQAFSEGLKRFWQTLVKTLQGIWMLISGQISFENLGGPIAIGELAEHSWGTGISYFLQMMALISINLGVLNLFPIPILDGGHIMFVGLELIMRRPLGRRTMEIAQQIGLTLLLLLMAAAIFNDVRRIFPF
ncbi:MAG: RIP metalloprotease RseP, partial [Bacteriovoracaceae bacterium]|nr:RIP metalloprotease RseP [Bacteriovoracaceae bacterium]